MTKAESLLKVLERSIVSESEILAVAPQKVHRRRFVSPAETIAKLKEELDLKENELARFKDLLSWKMIELDDVERKLSNTRKHLHQAISHLVSDLAIGAAGGVLIAIIATTLNLFLLVVAVGFLSLGIAIRFERKRPTIHTILESYGIRRHR